jgi:hypothetical protein
MNKNILVTVLLLVVGCDYSVAPMSPTDTSDAGTQLLGDAAVFLGEDAEVPPPAPDAAVMLSDAGAVQQDAALPPVTDAGVVQDAAMPAPDAAVPPVERTFGRPVKLSGTCVLDDRQQMWCWGGGALRPQYVAQALDISGACGLAEDYRRFCWRYTTGVETRDLTMEHAFAAGEVRRSDGHLVLRDASWNVVEEWVPPSPVASVHQLGIAHILESGALWYRFLEHRADGTYTLNMWNAVTDTGPGAYRVVDACAGGGVACWQSEAGTSMCWNAPLTQRRIAPLSSQTYEVEIIGTELCMLSRRRENGTGGPGVRCINAATFADSTVFPAYMEYDGLRQLTGSGTVACALRGDEVLCWGSNRDGELGDGTRTSRMYPAPVRF